MSYQINFTKNALQDLKDLKKSEPLTFKKLQKLLFELLENPQAGTGKPELLKGLKNTYSRRINQKHRLVYQINTDSSVFILAAKGHYKDK